jgi:hypothetical protein
MSKMAASPFPPLIPSKRLRAILATRSLWSTSSEVPRLVLHPPSIADCGFLSIPVSFEELTH